MRHDPRHLLRRGVDDQYDRARKTLKTGISDATRATINSTVAGFPMSVNRQDRPQVIIRYGDEDMKVLLD